MAFRNVREFIQLESSGGIVLFFAAVLALIVDNTALHPYYQSLFNTIVAIHIGSVGLSKPFLLWINDGLMAIFFLLVGLEIKREMLVGELNSLSKAVLPAIAAVGGMVVPALIYVGFNYDDSVALRGWAIPTATDIAFSLGLLALLGSRIPPALKIFLTALAIFDDLGAIIIIAVFYAAHISLIMLAGAVFLTMVLFLFNRLKITSYAPYMIVGFLLWICVLKSGVHATLSGIVLAFAIPMKAPKQPGRSPLTELEHKLHPWVAFGVLPLFAFANAGISFVGLSMDQLLGAVPLGIMLGLFLGKQLGIWGAVALGVKTRLAKLPAAMSLSGVYGVGLLAGVGFTMSLFIGTLAFGHQGSYPAMVRIGVIAGSVLSGVMGYLMLRFAYRRRYTPNLQREVPDGC